jgi:hypothetical protein
MAVRASCGLGPRSMTGEKDADSPQNEKFWAAHTEPLEVV